jgi:hypothetical protein
MKQKFLTFVAVILALSSIHVQAQQHDESNVKIMPTSKPGVLRLVHAIPTTDPVSVQFITDHGVVSSDEIKGDFPKGISRRYDFRQIDDKDFRMLISSPTLSVTYHIVLSDDRKTFTPYLEKAVHSYNTLASTK